ncbi:hypothetical protein DICPUDRAFT_6061, partial [Dictyostelium purpureum]
NKRTPFLVLAYLYFIVIASVLGTGILGLPVKLSHSGFKPFVASYTLCFFMQLLSIFFLIEVLQRIYSIIKANSILSTNSFSSSPIDDRSRNEIDVDNTGIPKNNIQLDILNHNSGTAGRRIINSSSGVSPDLNNENNNDTSELSESTDIKASSNGGSSIKSSPTLNDRSEGDNDEETMMNEKLEKENREDNENLIQKEEQEEETKQAHSSTEKETETPNLHIIGLKFLGPISYAFFIFSVLLHFCSVLIGYGLAGSEAYAQLFSIDHSFLIFPVILLFTIIVIFGSKSLGRIITLFTFAKGTLLMIIVFITGIISNHVQNNISNDWSYIGKSFLISTVALGGASSVLPVVFPKIVFTKREIKKCYTVAGSALFTVYILNIIWCWFLLQIIPQVPNPNNPGFPSLEEAAIHGEIATIPLMKVVSESFPQFLWIAYLVNIFIVISITISFITVGTGFKHTLDGFSITWRKKSLSNSYHEEEDGDEFYNNTNSGSGLGNANPITQSHDEDDNDLLVLPASVQDSINGSNNKLSTKFKIMVERIKYKIIHQTRKAKLWIYSKINLVNSKIDDKEGQSTMEQNFSVRFPIREFIFYIGFFGFILLVALMNPKGFLQVMESGTSLGLNLQSGTFMVMMLQFARSHYGQYSIPLPVHNYIYNLRYFVFAYFTFAVLYDFYVILF